MNRGIGRWLAALAMLVCSAMPSCTTSVEDELSLARLEQRCLLNSDCEAPLVCVFELCHQECSNSRDCPAGSRCVNGAEGRHVCQLPGERKCEEASECPGEQVCGADAECRDSCGGAQDCVGQQVCSGETCADPAELDEQGSLPVARCHLDSDCPGTLLCVSGDCRAECREASECKAGASCEDGLCQPLRETPICLRSSDCSDGERCDAGACLPVTLTPEPCRYNSDCSGPAQHCVKGGCACECTVDADCPRDGACSDGCACTPNRRINGSVRVTNLVQAQELADVVEITGVLELAPGAPVIISLPLLEDLGALRVEEADTVFIAESLGEVKATLTCKGDCRLPRLRLAGELTLMTGRPLPVSFPLLEGVGELRVQDSQAASLALPSLASVTNLTVTGNTTLAALELPALTMVSNVSVIGNPGLVSFSLPQADTVVDSEPPADPDCALPHAGKFEVSRNPLLTSLTLGVTLSESITIETNARLETLSLSKLRCAASLWVKSVGAVKTFELTSLKGAASFYVDESGSSEPFHLPILAKVDKFYVNGLFGARTLLAPQLKTPGSVEIMKSSFVTLDLALETVAGGVEISANWELTQLRLAALTEVGAITVAGNTALAGFDASLLDKVLGTFYLSNSKVTELDSSGGKLTKVGALSIFLNAELPTCSALKLAEKLAVSQQSIFLNLCPCPVAAKDCP